MRTTLILSLGLLVGIVACNKGTEGTAPSGSATATTTRGGAKTSLTQAQIDEAANLADPDKLDKSMTAVTGKLGAPQKTEGDTSIWYGVSKDGKGCYQLKISKTKGVESGTTDKANCGLE
ncbi:MAG: hypothetical protein IPI67_33435 [Myxococcales bacterium]|nr:hypothetical protein [Myxococcales bacterium]